VPVPCRDALFAKGLLRVQQYLAGGRDNTTCPICLGGIKPTEAIWACGKSCFALFHMPCIQVGTHVPFYALFRQTCLKAPSKTVSGLRLGACGKSCFARFYMPCIQVGPVLEGG
jgi:hypothetical protein